MKRFLIVALSVASAALIIVSASSCARTPARAADGASPKTWNRVFGDGFDSSIVVNETTESANSVSPNWWLDSGANINVANGVGSTIVGEAPEGYYRTRYAQRNPVDTDGGAHPQNVFRLLTTRTWSGATRQECYFRVLDYHLSNSPQRYDPNGLLIFTRYKDHDNLYYAGIRVDGHAVVKKKSAGVYYTLAERQVLPGHYDRVKEPTLLPKHRWIGLRSEAVDNRDGSVTVSLYMDEHANGVWKLLAEGIDAGVGGKPFRGQTRTGVRTDFMDVQLDNFAVSAGR